MVTIVSRQPEVSASPDAQRTRSLREASASLRNESMSMSRWKDGSNSDEEEEESSEGDDSLKAMQEL